MESLLAAHEALETRGNLSKAVDDVQKLIEQLQAARDGAAANPALTPMHVAKLKTPVKQSFEAIEDDLKEVNKGLNQYAKAMREKFKSAALPTVPHDVFSHRPDLINRAIAMHLLREGKFEVARTFVGEVNAVQKTPAGPEGGGGDGVGLGLAGGDDTSGWMKDFADPDAMEDDDASPSDVSKLGRGQLQKRFSEMYHILEALRNRHDLGPAIEWSRQHSGELESRGSNLEFELARLRFVELYTSSGEDAMSDDAFAGPARALDYARATFPPFLGRYAAETASLVGSLAFAPGLQASPYRALFYNADAWEEAALAFTREFCGMLGLSSASPLYTAVTAGGIALPVLEKVERVMAQARGQWTSVNELPVETPLPPAMRFHSIFVCPVSKDQATDENPPMMIPCGHVIAKESLEMHSRGKSRMKCPYCPHESHPRDARRVYF